MRRIDWKKEAIKILEESDDIEVIRVRGEKAQIRYRNIYGQPNTTWVNLAEVDETFTIGG